LLELAHGFRQRAPPRHRFRRRRRRRIRRRRRRRRCLGCRPLRLPLPRRLRRLRGGAL